MAVNGVVRYPTHLDPSAQEFRPTFPPPQHHHFPFTPPPHLHPSPPQQPPFFPELIYPPPHQPPPSPLSYMSPTLSPPPAFLPPSIPPPASAPTRAILLTAVPPDVSESIIRRELEIFGDVRAVQMGRVSEGIVTVHFYDLRAAHAALDAVREQHMQQQNRLRIHYSSILAGTNSFPGGGPPVGLEALAGPPPAPPPSPGLIAGRAVWAQFSVPATNAFPDGQNQGTVVIFNLNPSVSALTLKGIFQPFGAVKELRETPMKRQQRFVEFYDVRDASRALSEMNGKEINGRSVMIEFSRPGGHSNKKFNNPNHHHNHHFNTTNNSLNLNYQHTNNNHIAKPQPPPPPPVFPSRHWRTSPRQNVRRRRSSPMSSEDSLEVAMSGLALRGNNANNEDRKSGNVIGRKGGSNNSSNNTNGNCSSSGSSSSTSVKQQAQPSTALRKPWKGRQKNFDPRFLIKEDAIVDEESGGCKDTRTTIMIKNIPNKYSQKLVLNMLDNHCIHCNEQIAVAGEDQPLSSYDFVYLPIDFNNKCNVGYGFVNMTSPEATLRLYKSFHHQHWEVFNSRKICEVTYARVQGLEALKEHFKNSKFACENDEYLPVVFSPPRDGRYLTNPLPIVFTNTALSPIIHHHSTDVDTSDLTSTTTNASTCTTTTTLTHLPDDFDHEHDHANLTSTILEGNDDDDDDDERSTNSSIISSSNDGGCGVNVDDDDDEGSIGSSMGCSIAS